MKAGKRVGTIKNRRNRHLCRQAGLKKCICHFPTLHTVPTVSKRDHLPPSPTRSKLLQCIRCATLGGRFASLLLVYHLAGWTRCAAPQTRVLTLAGRFLSLPPIYHSSKDGAAQRLHDRKLNTETSDSDHKNSNCSDSSRVATGASKDGWRFA